VKDEGVTTLRDTLRNVPGISLAAGEAGAQGDNLTIRGFTARNDIFLDGIRDFGSYYRDTFNYEQVEALEGPAGIQFGRGSTGGVVNQESKVPTVQQFAQVQAQFGTDATRRITADVNQPVLGVLGGERGSPECYGTGERSCGPALRGDSPVGRRAIAIGRAEY
jgi:catecholate siderophore receptor